MFFKYIYENEDGFKCFDRYFEYIKSIKDNNPIDLFRFVSDKNRYNLSSKHSLHDSWLDSLVIREKSTEGISHKQLIDIEIDLLGPHHDRKFRLIYKDVQGYRLDMAIHSGITRRNDLLCHEF